MSGGDIFLAILAIIFPPIAVWIKVGICSCDSLINILLSCLGWLPGLLHAWYIIASYPDPYLALDQDDIEGGGGGGGGRVTYYYVSREGPPPRGSQPQHAPAGMVVGAPDGGRAHRELERSGGSGYGTLGPATRAGQAQGSRGSSPQPKGQQQQQSSSGAGNGEGGAGAALPPTYNEAVQGDHKVQTP